MFNSDNFDEKQYFHSYAPANPQYCYETAVFYEAPSFDAFVVEPKPGVLLDQERYLPIANVSRIMKSMIHPSGKLAKEAKECVQESVSEFIAFLASEAAEKCNREKRKTITADDLLNALRATGFGNYVDPLRIFLDKYREAFRITAPANQPHRHYAVTLPMEANGPQMMATAYISTESTTGDAQTITLPAGYTIAQQQLAGAPTVATNTFTTADGTTFVVVDAEERVFT
ncbi:unnamed protein product [Caenorhabditis auriculariae]|uniref:Transcription factor CBF/NF-Y/archaeal histone domain-containing protein n=1 Tax=Caenorhabditis auriculariae TaxID=2777116 RepID=A0A8S1HH67_9PELO|nr:unnamed protein product [Caenorhabditis auriculariae]